MNVLNEENKREHQFSRVALGSLVLSSCDIRDGSLRSDVLFKTIIRDMRKYYSLDLNGTTNFIKKKRHKDDRYFY